MVAAHLSCGVFSQRLWPEVGDIDDCWCLADIMGIHAIAAWVSLPAITEYRAAANRPDLPGPTGGSIRHSATAIGKLWPELKIVVSDNEQSFAQFKTLMKPGMTASVSVDSGALPPSQIFNFFDNHRVTIARVVSGTGLRIANPLAPAHSRYKEISEDALRRAMEAYPGTKCTFIVFPHPDQAFTTHPLYDSIAKTAREAGYAQGRKEGIAAAAAAAAATK